MAGCHSVEVEARQLDRIASAGLDRGVAVAEDLGVFRKQGAGVGDLLALVGRESIAGS